MRPQRNKIIVQAALREAEDYCRRNKISLSKLRKQKVVGLSDVVIFAEPVPEGKVKVKRGLLDDKSTQPKPTLVVRKTASGYMVEETNYTQEYLKS